MLVSPAWICLGAQTRDAGFIRWTAISAVCFESPTWATMVPAWSRSDARARTVKLPDVRPAGTCTSCGRRRSGLSLASCTDAPLSADCAKKTVHWALPAALNRPGPQVNEEIDGDVPAANTVITTFLTIPPRFAEMVARPEV